VCAKNTLFMLVVCVEKFFFFAIGANREGTDRWSAEDTWELMATKAKLNWKSNILESKSACGYDKIWTEVLKMHKTWCILSKFIDSLKQLVTAVTFSEWPTYWKIKLLF
jgi:hypothetical protein